MMLIHSQPGNSRTSSLEIDKYQSTCRDSYTCSIYNRHSRKSTGDLEIDTRAVEADGGEAGVLTLIVIFGNSATKEQDRGYHNYNIHAVIHTLFIR